MRPNGAGTTHNGVNGSGKTNGAAEPSMDEILSFLRGTLAEETDRAGALRPAAIDLAAPKPAAPAPVAAKAETSAPVAQSSLAQPRPVQPAPAQLAAAAAAQPGPTAATAAPAAPEPVPTPLKPVSMPFKDTRFARLSGTAPAHPEIVAEATVVTTEPAQAPATGGLSSLASARRPEQAPAPANAWPFATPPSRPASAPHWTAVAMSSAAPAQVPTPLSEAVSPPPVPASAPAIIDAEFNTVESAAADLLRPVLRQWLSENMPRIVEKALRIEMAGSAPPRRDK
jgi:cell pole-organizing protein PopZ